MFGSSSRLFLKAAFAGTKYPTTSFSLYFFFVHWKLIAHFIGRIQPTHSTKFLAACRHRVPHKTVTYDMFKDIGDMPEEACKGVVHELSQPDVADKFKHQPKLKVSLSLLKQR